MLLAPVSAIAVSEMSMLVGVGLQPGREVNFLITSECLSLLWLQVNELFLKLDPRRQVAKESQPLLLVFPGPAGLERVAVSSCPGSLLLQVALECQKATPQP